MVIHFGGVPGGVPCRDLTVEGRTRGWVENCKRVFQDSKRLPNEKAGKHCCVLWDRHPPSDKAQPG